jgi:hypothetical protein
VPVDAFVAIIHSNKLFICGAYAQTGFSRKTQYH